jgi:5,10-methylenetetrahydrofolate reductase
MLDPPDGEEWKALDNGLDNGTDMVRHIRKEFADNFTICVAGNIIVVHVVQMLLDIISSFVHYKKL